MLDSDWLSTRAPLGFLDRTTGLWKALGAGVFIYDDPFIWFVTAHHNIHLDKGHSSVQVLVNHSTKGKYLVDVDSLHKEHKLHWIVDRDNDIAATLFPADSHFLIKAIGVQSFIYSKDMQASMDCYSVGCPYGLVGFDMENMVPCVLDGIISGVDMKKKRAYVTVPTFPGNSGGPLFVFKQPIKANGGVELGNPTMFLGGIISQSLLVAPFGGDQGDPTRLPHLHLGLVIPSDFIHSLLHGTDAKALKIQIGKK